MEEKVLKGDETSTNQPEQNKDATSVNISTSITREDIFTEDTVYLGFTDDRPLRTIFICYGFDQDDVIVKDPISNNYYEVDVKYAYWKDNNIYVPHNAWWETLIFNKLTSSQFKDHDIYLMDTGLFININGYFRVEFSTFDKDINKVIATGADSVFEIDVESSYMEDNNILVPWDAWHPSVKYQLPPKEEEKTNEPEESSKDKIKLHLTIEEVSSSPIIYLDGKPNTYGNYIIVKPYVEQGEDCVLAKDADGNLYDIDISFAYRDNGDVRVLQLGWDMIYGKVQLTKDDPVNHPSHYTDGKIEVADFIIDKKLNFCLGNAIKYISRAGKKDPTKKIEDLQKAIWYINREITELEKEAK